MHFDFTITWAHIIALGTIAGLFWKLHRFLRAGEVLIAEHDVMWGQFAKQHNIKLSPSRLRRIPQYFVNEENGKAAGAGN